MTEPDFTTAPDPVDATAAGGPPGPIVAYAGRYYRNARYVMAVACLLLAGWFAYDGWVKWPAENQRYQEMLDRREKPDVKEHSELDLKWQKGLAMGLPVVGLGIVGWMLYRSRGCYRLADDVLHVPGHPPVPLAAIREIDKTKWEKKGIALIRYELDPADGGGGPVAGTLVLDDFVYQQDPTDAILKTVETTVAPEEDGQAAAAVESNVDSR